MSSLDYMDVCRLCLVKDRVTVPIFEGEGNLRQIYLKISSCLQVKIAREDKLPQKICEECVYKVELFFEFWNQTLNVDKQLQQWLENVDKQGYAVATVLNQSGMKGEQSNENRLDGSVMQQVSGHQSSMNMGMDNIGVCMPMMIPNNNQQQITSVPMDTSGSSVQNVQVVAGSSTQTTHDQITQNQTNAPTQQEEEEESSEDEENSDDECDGDDGLPIKEESEEDPNNSRTIEPTTFVNVSLACEDPGPSGLQQQKMSDIQEMTQATDVDPKTGVINGNGYFLYGKESIRMMPWQIVDLAGHPYYAFLPANQIPKTEEEILCDSKQLVSTDEHLSGVVNDNNDDDDDAMNVSVITPNDNDDNMTYTDMLGNVYTIKIKQESESPVKKELDEDENDDDDDSKVYNCDQCNICFPLLQMLKKHRRTVHQKRAPRYKCKVCLKIYRSMVAFKMHVNLVHQSEQDADERNADEENADERNVEEQNAVQQNADEQNPTGAEQQLTIYRCNLCDYESSNKSTFYSHINRKHSAILSGKRKGVRMRFAKPEMYTCDACGFRCQSRRRLKEHIERKHESEYKYSCEHCGKKFKVKGDMRLHVRFKHKESPIVCDVCGKTCSNSNSLYVHQKWAHFKPKYECEICKRRMVTQENLDQHILLQHERKENYVCEECGKSFSENHRLKQHMMTHTGDRPYDCHVCGKSFTRRTAYRQHLLIHTGKRPYVCDICGKAFTQKPGLICHRKSHPGVHPPLPVVHIEHILNDFMKNK
ncbi:PREDICTED: zinc finger protein 852-like isoform X3 [Dinoponera quadriceps]|uniref:Zinc finger protein 852-like isoform X3 n=1 Tax=Dinoponera quadriceps TaxID=609295 RepID=A0A6P3X0D7_DINQU|nr:PREDICTED: zinc finger protein 852-like isoform X3 [Dinoponera quadriceps]